MRSRSIRVVLTLVLVVLPAALAAQLPRPGDLAGIVRKLPSLDGLMKNRPLDSTIDDAVGPQLFLDQRPQWFARQPGDMRRLPRTSNGGVALRPGLWEGTFESYCLRPATWTPGSGDGYLWGPLKGARAGAIGTILRVAAAHPNIPQSDIQMLLWAMLSRTRVSEMPPKLQAAARVLLPASEIRALNVSGQQALDLADRTRLFRGVTGPLRRALDVESELRYEFSRANDNYAQIEKIAVLGGRPPGEKANTLKRGNWSRTPGRYYVRFLPDGFSRMTLQVFVPARVRIERDQLHRITLVENAKGRTEIAYNDAVAPRTHPRLPQLKAYAFRSVRNTRIGSDGRVQALEVRDKGWTFVQARPQRRGVADRLADGARWLQSFFETPVEARQFDWDGWIERAQDAYEHWEDYEWLRDRAEATTTTGDESAVEDFGDSERVREGVIVVVVGDESDRIGFIDEMHERLNEMLEHATAVIDGAPTTSTTDDGFDFGGGAGYPGSGQTLGVSGR